MKKITTILLLFAASVVFIASDRHDNSNRIINNQYPLVVDSKKLDANTISTWFRNNGSFNRDPVTGNAGFEWPKGQNKTARYASGLWLGAVVGNDTLIAMAEYDYEYLPGYTDGSGSPQGKDDPPYRVYKITKGINSTDRQQWPNALLGNSDQGAPVFNDNGTWKPLDYGSQTLYYVYTDSYPEAHGNRAGSTRPLKCDIKQINFAFNFGGALGRIAFTQLTVINRSTEVWNNTYLTQWSDDDLGTATDDLVAVDSAIGLGYTYNATDNDGTYGAHPPAVGFDFFRGAIIFTGQNTDTAYVCDGKTRVPKVGYKQLGLTVFNWYSNGGAVYGDPRIYRETYREIKGLTRDGNVIINPVGNYPTTFMYSGDPVTNTGWVTGPMAPDDQRFLQSTGPFTMNPGDTQVIVVGQVIARGTSNFNSITELRKSDVFAQKIYDNCFNTPSPPPSPNTSYYAPGNGKIYISWDDIAEHSHEFNIFDSSYYNFEGYNVYQIRPGTDGSEAKDRTLLATYDIRDGVTDIYDSIFASEYNNYVYALTQKGYDNGISRLFILDRDNFGGGHLINGTPYCISITAYSYDPRSGFSVGTPKANESAVSGNVICIIPQNLVEGTIVHYNFGDTVQTNRRDLGLMPIVVDPLSLITATYTSIYGTRNDTLVSNLFRTIGTTTLQLDTNNADFSSTQDSAKVFDGIMNIHQVISDSGVVRDPDDPLSLITDIHTKLKGWSYIPPQNQWVQGPDTSKIKSVPSSVFFRGRQFESRSMGLSWPNQNNYKGQRTKVVAHGLFFEPGVGTNPNLQGGPLRKVRIVFGQQQLAYRYVPVAPLSDSNFSNSPYVDYVNVPFQVFAVDPLDSSQGAPRQLNCAFIDADNNGIWDPDTTKMGKFQMLYIFASSYDPNPQPSYTTRNPGLGSPSTGFPAFDILYVWLPRIIKTGPQTYTNGDMLEIYPYILTRADFVPGFPVSYAYTIQGTEIANTSVASANKEMEKIKVFPNPYYGQSRLEINPIDRFVYFSHLPKECTIYIYTLNGVLIRKIYRNTTDPKISLEKWDLRNESDIPVASGMYIALVDAPGIGTKILKLAIFTPEERIDTF